MSPRTPSPFAIALRNLLEKSNRFNREGWCQFLGVSSPAISQWLSDETLPRPDVLRAIVDELDRTSTSELIDPTPLAEFRRLCDSPSSDVSPNAGRLGPSIGHYLLGPLREAFLGMLNTLPASGQELILREGLLLIDRASHPRCDIGAYLHARDLQAQYLPRTELRDRDLVALFGGPRWRNITVVGAQPLELLTQPMVGPSSVAPELVKACLRNQLRSSGSSGIQRTVTYVLPSGSQQQVDSLADLFYGGEPAQASPLLLEASDDLITEMLQTGRDGGRMPVLLVLLDMGEPSQPLGYAWYESEPGVVLTTAQLAAVRALLRVADGQNAARPVSPRAAA